MKNATDKLTIVLAYADRYMYPILVLITLLKKNFLLTGIACFVFAIDKKVLKLIIDWFTVYISVLNGFINRFMRKNVLPEIHIQKISRVH